MDRRKLAIQYFLEGYNDSQSIVLAFKDLLPDYENILKASVGFGGGYGRMRETCGAVSGMVLVYSSLRGYTTPETSNKKHELYENIQELLEIFEKKYGSLTCRSLLNLEEFHSDPKPSVRDDNFYKTRPCVELVGGAAEILENFLKSH